MKPLTEKETAYILSILARHWNDEDIRSVMRLLVSKRVYQDLYTNPEKRALSE